MAIDYTKALKRANGMIVPQYWNEDIQDWEVVQGSNGSYRMQSTSYVAKYPFSGSANMTKEFTEIMSGLVISNDGNADLTVTINGDTYKVYAGAVLEENFAPFTSVTISTTVPFQAYGKVQIGGLVVTQPPVVDIIAPANVTNPVISNLTATSLTLAWTGSASSDCTGYDIYRGATLLGSVAGTVTTYNVTGLTQATQYTFTIKAKDAANNIATGTPTTITTASSSDTTPPINVTNLTKSNLTQSGVTLSWNASVSSDVASYDIYDGSTFLANVTSVTYNVSGLAASTAYTFWVKAKDASGNSASGTSIAVTTTAVPDTTVPTVTISPAAGTYTSTQSVALTGTDNSGGAVTIYYTTDGSTPTQSSTVYNGTAISVPATATISYFGKDASGNVSTVQTATYTITVADTTAPNPISGLTAGTSTSNSVPLTWTISDSSDVANQEVAYSSNGGTSYTVASGVINPSSNSYTVTGLAANQPYTFRVVAIDTSNNRSTNNPTTTATTSSSQVTYVSDDFNRADSASLGTATTGHAWTNGSWQIIGNQAGTSTALQATAAWSVIDSTHADNIEISLDAIFPAAGWGSSMAGGIVFRFASGDSMYCFGPKSDTAIGIYQAGATGVTIPANQTVPSMALSTHTFKVKIVGQIVECYMDGVLKMSITDNVLTANTKHGIGLYQIANGPKFDNFFVKSV